MLFLRETFLQSGFPDDKVWQEDFMTYLETLKPFFKERYFLNNAPRCINDGRRLAFYAFYESEYYPKFQYERAEYGRFFNIFYILSGTYEKTTKAGKKELFTAGTFVVDNMNDPFSRIRNGGDTACRRKCILLLKNDFSRKFVSLFFPEGKIKMPVREEEKLLVLMDKIKSRFSPALPELDVSGTTGDLAELFDFVNSQQTKRDSGSLLPRLLAYMESRLFDPTLQREDISSHGGISPSTLDRLFRKEMGKSVNGYLTEKRLEHVAQLLALPLLRSKEIAATSGFASTIYMDRLFREKYGMTPTQYRKRLASISPAGEVQKR